MAEPAEGSVASGKIAPVPEEALEEVPEETSEKQPKVVKGSSKNEEVAREVLAGQWGRGKARDDKLREAGHDPSAVHKEVLKILGR